MQALAKVSNVSILPAKRVYHDIQTYLRARERQSKNTKVRYEYDIRQFFNVVKHKNIEDLTVDDLQVRNTEVLDYQDFLCQKYKNSVVNGKLEPLKSLYDFLKRNEYPVNPAVFKVDNLPDDTKPIGYLSPDEVDLIADLALEEIHKPKLKHALIWTAYATSMRLNALLKIKFKHIRLSEHDPDKYLIETDYFDKGKKVFKELHRDGFEKILEAKPIYSDEEYIFDISDRTARSMMERLCKKAGFDPRRSISFHSIRKAGTDFVHEYTNGDIFAVASQGNWSDVNTAYQRYLKPQANIAGMAVFERISDDIFDELTHEEAIQLLKSISGKSGAGVRLRREAKKIISKRNKKER